MFSYPAQPSENWLFVIDSWGKFVKNATPLFTTLEGFCTLLVIQTAGQISLWLIRTKSETWMIIQLLLSSVFISSSLYFLYRIYSFPVVLGLASATLIGAVLTVCAFLGLYGILSGKGNAVESSLLFSYVVYCLYLTFTDFQSSISLAQLHLSNTPVDIPPLPPLIITGYTNLMTHIAELIPSSFNIVILFLQGAVATITPSVMVSLAYRLAVFYAGTRIIPAVQNGVPKSRHSSITGPPNSRSRKPQISSPPSPRQASTIQYLIYAYSPCIIISVYTHLLIQHRNVLVPDTLSGDLPTISWWRTSEGWTNSREAWQFWGWVNMFTTLGLYALELVYGKESSRESVIENHWKTE